MSQKTVLVIDDDLDLRETIALALEAEDYRVITATNGKNALELLAKASPDSISCIVLDLMMPEMDGKEFLERLRIDCPQFAKVPVVVATAMGVPVDNILIPYPVARIQKPMELDALYRILEDTVKNPPMAP